MKYKLIKQIEDGHRFFKCGDAIAVVDHSGSNPDNTDDGPLFLDFSRFITKSSGNGWVLPLVDEEGDHTTTLSNDWEAVYCVREHRMKLKIADAVFAIVQ